MRKDGATVAELEQAAVIELDALLDESRGNGAVTTTIDLAGMAGIIADNIDDHFPAAEAADRQVLCLAEEVGEFVGAFRRANGMARRSGTFGEMRAELADVVITTYVSAHVLGISLSDSMRPVLSFLSHGPDVTGIEQVLALVSKAGQFADAYRHGDGKSEVRTTLEEIAFLAYAVASVLGIDLEAAIADKLAIIFTRGWKEPRLECDNCGMVFDPTVNPPRSNLT
ncbi:MAG: hypothetical protein ACREQ5_01810 [Candidatus Dormibacteria bacterium]